MQQREDRDTLLLGWCFCGSHRAILVQPIHKHRLAVAVGGKALRREGDILQLQFRKQRRNFMISTGIRPDSLQKIRAEAAEGDLDNLGVRQHGAVAHVDECAGCADGTIQAAEIVGITGS